ncbi:BA75_00660T0 [Komagataella pastoris]|uniref:Ammonium transporter n=1 Tax=Komagataella pastoris TaxID=4922 RepID=A0A1B2J530_PICPA|nr:BA75_00660T0 [Komagataella pastoris]
MSEETPLPSGYYDSGTGGNSLEVDLNVRFDKADMVWVAVSGCLVFLMVPGVGLLYSGLARKKHALSLLWASLMAAGVVSFQWFFWGYSLVFGRDSSNFLGNMKNFCLMDVLGAPSTADTVPDILFCFFQGMFAMVTGCLMVGGACERAALGPMMVFLFCWVTVVYCPIAAWTWNANGWLAELGALDFAGGGPVHMNSGAGALAYALWLGKRKDPAVAKGVPKYKPHSVTSVVLGTVFLWFGWFGFNGGSTGNASMRSWYACVSTNLAAGTGALSWLFVDYFRFGRKWTTTGMCCGAISGLVAITPAAGYTPVYFAVAFGVVAGALCNFAVELKFLMRIDDGMDVFALHGVGGFIGSVMTGLFAADYVAALDGTEIDGGWINQHYVQLGYQLAACCATLLWSFGITSILLNIQDRIPFLKLRLSEDQEIIGTDAAVIGEFTYADDHQDNMFIPQPEPTPLSPIKSIRSVLGNNKSQNPPANGETLGSETSSGKPE